MADEHAVRTQALKEALDKLGDVNMILGRANHPPQPWMDLEALVRNCSRETARLYEDHTRSLVPDAR